MPSSPSTGYRDIYDAMESVTRYTTYEYFLVDPGPRPPYWEVAYHLWGHGCDFDSDGNSEPDPATVEWTELTLELRSEKDQRIDIDPILDEDFAPLLPLVLMITSEVSELAEKTALFLHNHCGGRLTRGEIVVSTMAHVEVEPGIIEASSSPMPTPLERLSRSREF